jgi:hypothetical protein
MIHVYKSGGPWKTDGKEYTVKAIQPEDKSKYISDGWVSSLDEVKKPKAKKAKVIKDDNKE